MANFHFGFDCESEEIAEKLEAYIAEQQIYQDELERYDDRVNLVTTQAILALVLKFSETEDVHINVEAWPEGVDYDDAEEAGDIETYSLPIDKPNILG